MLEKSIRTDTKKLINQRRALFQNNTIKMGKLKKELSKDVLTSKDPQDKPNTIRNVKGSFFNINNFSGKSKIDFPPKEISSKQFQQEVITDIENVNLFGGAEISVNNKSFANTSGSQVKRPFRLNPLKISSRMQKKVLKIDDFILLESELPNVFLSDANKFNLNSQQLKDFNKQLLHELKKLNVFAEQTPKVEVASYSKKLINKKAYKTYDKVLGDKFKFDFLTNKMNTRQNNLRTKMRIDSNSKENSFTYKTQNSAVSEQNENYILPNKIKKKNSNLGIDKEKDFSQKEMNGINRNKKTYLTAFDALDSINNLEFSDTEGIANPLSKNIQSKLEKFSKHIQTENSQTNTSFEHLKDKNKSPLVINNSRRSSNDSRSRMRAKSNSDYNTINNSSLGNLNSKSPGNRKGKNDKSFLDNYIRLPKIVVSKINVNHTSIGNSNVNSNRNYVQNEVVLESKQLLKGFNKTKKARYNLDSLVSKISYKIGNGFPLKKYVTNYDSFSNVYPKKNFTK